MDEMMHVMICHARPERRRLAAKLVGDLLAVETIRRIERKLDEYAK